MPENSASLRCCRIQSNSRTQDLGFTLCIYAASIMLGFVLEVFLNSMWDFMKITNKEELTYGIWFPRSFLIGCGLGALTGGILYDTFKRNRVFVICLLVIACTMAVAPWCSLYWAAISAHVTQGIAVIVAVIGGTAEILSIGRGNRMSFIVLTLLNRCGRFSAALITKQEKKLYRDINSDEGFMFAIRYPIIVSGIVVLAGLFSLPSFVCNTSVSGGNSQNFGRSGNQPRELPRKVKFTAVTIMSACIALCTRGADTSIHILRIYLYHEDPIPDLYWNIEKLEYAEYGMVLACAVVTMFLTRCNTMAIAGSHCVFIFLSLSAFMMCVLFESVLGVSISFVAFGCFQAVLYSLLFIWTDEYITQVTGKISSFIVMMSLVVYFLSEVLIFNIMDSGNMWLSYGIQLESFLLFLLCTTAFIMTRHIERRYGKTYSNINRTYDEEIVLQRLVMNEH